MSVAVKRCAGYEPKAVESAVDAALSLLGGMEKFVSPGMKVLIKPNLLMPVGPEKCATTHPQVVRAVIEAVQAAGARPFLGECPGGTYNPAYIKYVFAQTGMESVAAQTGCPIVYDYDVAEGSAPGTVLEHRPAIATFFKDCDAIISVAKLKTHGYMGYTGAVKNMFGAVPGLHKAQYHLKYPNADDFASAILDIYLCAKPTLAVVDAVVGMEGDGPSGGRPRAIGAIFAGDDPHALDYICAQCVGIAPESVPTLKLALSRGLFDPENISLLGDEPPKITNFLMPAHRKLSMIPGYDRLACMLADKFLRAYPRFGHPSCTGCGICAHNCPPKAITMVERRPRLDRRKCISCFCCHEFCPSHAISISNRFHINRKRGNT